MKYLVDTNAWIAFFQDAPFLSEEAADLMESPDTECFVSIVSIWEAAIKIGLGKLKLPYDLDLDLPKLLSDNSFEILPVEFGDAAGVCGLENIHGDPFDRIMVIQARRRNWPIISRDSVFDQYDLRRIW